MTRDVDQNSTGNGDGALRRRWSWPLRPAVLMIVMAMTAPVLLGIIYYNYQSTERLGRENAQVLIESFRTEVLEDIAAEFETISSQIATAAELGHQAPDFYQTDAALGYLFRGLEHTPTALNFYVGLEDGSFRQARRITDPSIPVFGNPPPAGTEYAYRVLVPEPDRPTQDRYTFLNAQQGSLGVTSDATSYDPRVRFWYQQAVDANKMIMTDTELFWVLGLVGFSVAAPFHDAEGELRGVMSMDVTLDGFSEYLAANSVSPGSVSYLLDDSGNVLAASDFSVLRGVANSDVALQHITETPDRVIAQAYTNRPSGSNDTVYPFRYDDVEYIVGVSEFPGEFGKPWRLMVLTPMSDFTAALTAHNQSMAMFGLAAVAIQLVIIYIVASHVAAPLQRLAAKVERIQSLEPSDDLPLSGSSVREVDTLSRAIGTLDVAVNAFARFVPVGLVQQLLTSDQRLEIGGQSKFLTMFFSDVEGFSTLAEQMASRELLGRVSTMLEVISKSVHRENGTIDKFIGDGAMAFWGAPSDLDNHAWHACVAAMRVQRDMDEFNAGWRSEGALELKLRIGIHSDAVLVGNVGSKERISYTVLGDGVNIAARLETLNKEYGTRICISHDTFQEAGDMLCVRPIDEVVVKGRRAGIVVYELLGAYGSDAVLAPTAAQENLARQTRDAFQVLRSGDLEGALEIYKAILQAEPTDLVAKSHVDRLSASVTAVQ